MVSSSNTKIQNLKTSIVNKITSLIGTHNSSNSAHSDIRTSLNNKANAQHTHDIGEINHVDSLDVVVTYTDDSTGTLRILILEPVNDGGDSGTPTPPPE